MNYIYNINRLKKTILFLLLLIPVMISAQQEPEGKEELRPIDRIFFGGNFGIMFGTITSIEVSPLIGYYLTPRLAAGVGIRFEYFRDKGYSDPYETMIYGSNVFSRYMIISNLAEGLKIPMNIGVFIHAEYEALSLEKSYFEPFAEDGRFIVHSVLLGGGILQPIGKRSAFLLTILYNLNESSRSPYSNPIIRVGFNF